MPMYEKGSVRAEPRSKQQERMKKIMKKFLSSLLALTMILSLVIVPANAADTDVTAPESTSVNKGSTQTVMATAPTSTSFSELQGKGNYTAGDTTWRWSESSSHFDIKSGGDTATVTIEGKSKTTSAENLTCTYEVVYTKAQDNTTEGAPATITVTRSATVKVTVNDKLLASDVASVTVNGRTYSVNSGNVTAYYFGSTNNLGTYTATLSDSNYTFVRATKSGETLTIYARAAGASEDESVNLSLTEKPATTTLTVTEPSSLSNFTAPMVNHKYTLTANYTCKDGSSNVSTGNVVYKWTITSGSTTQTYEKSTNTYDWTPTVPASYSISCAVYEGDNKAAELTNPIVHDVDPERYELRTGSNQRDFAVTSAKTVNLPVPSLYQKTLYGGQAVADSYTINWEVTSGKTYVSVNQNGVATGLRSGTATVVASTEYQGGKYSIEYKVTVSALDGKLDEVVNGSSLNFDLGDLEKLAEDAIYKVIKTDVTINAVTIKTLPATADGAIYKNSRLSTKVTAPYTVGSSDELYFDAADGFLGTASMTIEATDTRNTKYNITVDIPVVGDKDIKDTVTGTAAGKSVTFTNSDYKYLYYTTSKVTDYTGHFDGTSVSGYTLVKEDKDVTVTASQFGNNNSVTLYVVGVDKDYVASTGTITVSQKSYDINYNVVAGKSVTFSQKDFEDFLENYADDNGDYNSRKDELSFDHAVLTSSIPSTKNEGTLYYGSTEITSSNKSKTDMTDMDKVSFDSVSKPSKDTVTLTFKVYGDLYKNGSSKKTEVKYDVNVVISVVKEDITYTVGIDDTVQMTARDFVNFLQDAKTSYRKAELDYVKFDVSGKNVSSYAYGGLYRSYSSYSTGKLADSTDKFYYEPSRTQYDLADVAYHTTRWAEAGKTVYIPFTVYGTKGEEASGTMAITIAQTMNFIDVKASDFFYEPVKWAVNNKITNGTSSTTFSPYKNCNRAEIVTFLWRAAGSPEPTVTRNPFTDVNSVRDASYYKAILWASQKGITAGSTATTFSPYQECTRSQIVTFLYRYAGKPSGYYSNPFKDVSSVNEASYYNAILWAVGKGITQGTSTTTFSPYASCTRGEAVTFLYRYVNGVK